MDWTALINPVANLVDTLVYTDQEKAAAALAGRQVDAALATAQAQQANAAAALTVAQQQAQTMRLLGILGAGVIGLGVIVWSTRA